MYLLLKHLHVTCVVLSGLGFLLRLFWRLWRPQMLARRWVRVVPHGVDSLLLGAALGMVVMSGQYPFVQPWLTAKVLALIGYILLGSLALKRCRSPLAQLACGGLAMLMFAYIVSVALSRQVLPWTA